MYFSTIYTPKNNYYLLSHKFFLLKIQRLERSNQTHEKINKNKVNFQII